MSLATKTRYDGVAMIIHWLTAVLMIYMVFFGEDLIKSGMRAAKAGDAANATFQPSIHVSIGITILLLTVLRVIWRLTHPAPAYPASMKHYEVVGSKALHGIFYLLLLYWLVPMLLNAAGAKGIADLVLPPFWERPGFAAAIAAVQAVAVIAAALWRWRKNYGS